MSLKIKFNKSPNTHENEQFRRIAESLKILFDNKKLNGLFIGNPISETEPRFRPDAILYYDYGIILIDFKDYSGEISLPSNQNDFKHCKWTFNNINSKEKIVIKAGTKFINPFIQLNYYRYKLISILQNKVSLFKDVNPNQIFCINIFTGPIKINNLIPGEYKKFYKILDEDNLSSFLLDYSSENKYQKENSTTFELLFKGEIWDGNISIGINENTIENELLEDGEVKEILCRYLAEESKKIIILESHDEKVRLKWMNLVYLLSEECNIPQVEAWVHSKRILKKILKSTRIEMQSLYGTIYGGNSIEREGINSNEEEVIDENNFQEVIPIQSLKDIETKALIVLYEAHFISNSYHDTQSVRFGSGHLLKDMLEFLSIEKSNRKLIFIGDPYSLSFGSEKENALNKETISKLSNYEVISYRQQIDTGEFDFGKENLRLNLANNINEGLYNNLNYKWSNNLIKLTRNDLQELLNKYYRKSLVNEPPNIVMTYSNNEARQINLHIKDSCIKNGKRLNKGDLLIVDNNSKIITGIDSLTISNGMFLKVNSILDKKVESINLKTEKLSIELKFTKINVNCLSLDSKPQLDIWILNNYFDNDNLTAKEEIALKILFNKLVRKRVREIGFKNHYIYQDLLVDEQYIILSTEEKAAINDLIDEKEKITTTKNARRILSKYKKKFFLKILNDLKNIDPFFNYVEVKYGWALTVHKCLGHSFNDSILLVDSDAIRSIKNSFYFRWLYSGLSLTGCSAYIYNPLEIYPVSDCTFDDIETNDLSVKDYFENIIFEDYIIEKRYLDVINENIPKNIAFVICELSKLFEINNLKILKIKRNGDYQTKVIYSDLKNDDIEIVICISNKSESNKWAVSNIQIEKCKGFEKEEVLSLIDKFYLSTDKSEEYPNDFRNSLYNEWRNKFHGRGIIISLIKLQQYQDIFRIINGNEIAIFKVIYTQNGFISNIKLMKKTSNSLGQIIKEITLSV